MPSTPKKSDVPAPDEPADDAPVVETQAKPPDPPHGSTQYRYVGDRATILESGQPLGPGEYVNLTTEEATTGQNQRLITDGRLIDATGATPQPTE